MKLFSVPPHLAKLIRGKVTPPNILPGTSEISSPVLFWGLLFCFVFLCLYFVFPGKIQVSYLSSIFILQNTLFLDGGGERERIIFLSTLSGRNAIKAVEYEFDTTLGPCNPVSLKLNRPDSEDIMIHSISNSAFVVEMDQTLFPGPHCIALKYHCFQSLPKLQSTPDCAISPSRAWRLLPGQWVCSSITVLLQTSRTWNPQSENLN